MEVKEASIMTYDQNFCIKTLADWAGGEHHLPEVKPFGEGVSVNWSGDIATVDFDGLTRLVLLAHRDAVRIQVSYSGPRMIRIAAHRRQHGDRKTMGFSRWHPGLEELRTDIERMIGQ